MSYSISGNNINQSGDNPDLSEFTNVPEATYTPYGSGNNFREVVDSGTLQLVINGTQTIPNRSQLFSRFVAPAHEQSFITVKGGGKLTVGELIGTALAPLTHISSPEYGGHSFRRQVIAVDSGGEFEWVSGVIESGASFRFAVGATVNISGGTLYNWFDDGSAYQFRFDSSEASSDALINITGLTLDGQGATLLFTNSGFNELSGLVLKNGAFQTSIIAAPSPTLVNLEASENRFFADVVYNDNNSSRVSETVFIDPSGAVRGAPANNSSGRLGFSTVKCNYEINTFEPDGTPSQPVTYYLRDSDSGNRRVVNGIEYPDDITYTGTGTGNAISLDEIIIQTQTIITSELIPLDDFRFTGSVPVSLIGYAYSISAVNLDLYGNGVKKVNSFTLFDTAITNIDSSAVDSYATINTAEQLYDRSKSSLVNAYAGESEATVTRSSSTINARSYGVFINTGTANAYDFNGSNITINSDHWRGQSIITTASVTVADDVDITGSSFTTLNTAIGRTLTGVTADVLIFNDDIDGDYELIDCTIGVIANNGTGLLNFASIDSTVADATDAQVNVNTVLTVTDIDGDSIRLIVWDGDNVTSGAEIYNFAEGETHLVNITGLSSIRIIADKAGSYARTYDLDTAELSSGFVVNMERSPSVEITEDIASLVADTAVTIESNPLLPGFNILRATISNDHIAVSAAKWRRYHDFFSEQEESMQVLGLAGLDGSDVYETTASGVRILLPVLEVRAAGLNTVTTDAFIDSATAAQVFPPYDYTPRNDDNVSVENVTVEPLVDYALVENLIEARLQETHARLAVISRNNPKK